MHCHKILTPTGTPVSVQKVKELSSKDATNLPVQALDEGMSISKHETLIFRGLNLLVGRIYDLKI